MSLSPSVRWGFGVERAAKVPDFDVRRDSAFYERAGQVSQIPNYAILAK